MIHVLMKIFINNLQELLKKMWNLSSSTEKQNVKGVSFVSEMLTAYFTFLLSQHLSCYEIFYDSFSIVSQFLLFYDIYLFVFPYLFYCAETKKRQCYGDIIFSHECLS